MPASDYPIMTSALTPRKQEQFAEAIAALEEGQRMGEIPNAVYTRAKQTISRCAEYAWQERARKPYSWNREYIEGASEEERAKLYEMDSCPQVNTLGKLTRQAEALGDTAAGHGIRQLLDEARPVFRMIKTCKDIAVKKGQAPKPPTATERFQAPSASGTSMAAILAELTDITEAAREGIAQALANRHEKTVETFLASQRAHHEAVVVVGPQRFDIFNYARHLGRGRADAQLMDRLTVALDQMRGADGKKVYAWKPNGKDVIAQRSAKEAEAICQSYIEKNMAKLAPIVEARGDYAGMEIVGRNVQPGSMTGQLRISFEDGACFDARSQAVLSFSQYGTPFMRYPLTFHNVKLGNGSLMSRPSEQKMNEEFVQAAVEAPAP